MLCDAVLFSLVQLSSELGDINNVLCSIGCQVRAKLVRA
jgi:hypothetical protein